MNLYQKTPEEVLSEYQSDQSVGLSSEDARRRITKYGNHYWSIPKKDFFILGMLDFLKDPYLIVIVIFSIILSTTNKISLGIELLTTVLIFSSVIVYQQSSQEKLFDALEESFNNFKVKVLREGSIAPLPRANITLGDIVYLSVGDKIPADGRVLYSNYLTLNETLICSDSHNVEKISRPLIGDNIPYESLQNMVFSGTVVVSGSGVVLITAVGSKTSTLKSSRIHKENRFVFSPLQDKLSRMGKRLTFITLLCSGLIFLTEVIRLYQKATSLTVFDVDTLELSFITCIAFIISATPREITMSVYTSIVYGINKLLPDKLFVHKLHSYEKLPTINTVCLDMKGIFLDDALSVTEAWSGGQLVSETNKYSDSLLTQFCINTYSQLNYNTGIPKYELTQAEIAILRATVKECVNYQEIRHLYGNPIHEFLYTPEHKINTRIYSVNNIHKMYSMGDANTILEISDRLDFMGKESLFEKDQKEEISNLILQLQKQGKLVYGFAYKEMMINPDWSDIQQIESRMSFVGFVALESKLNPDVTEQIKLFEQAGITVKLFSEQDIYSTMFIADQVGIKYVPEYVLEGAEFDQLTDFELSSVVEKSPMFAGITPQIKARIVNLLQTNKNSTLVTGSNISDISAFHASSVGVSIGYDTCQILKEEAAIVINDKSMSSIVDAITWGRGIYQNFQRFIQFQLVILFATCFSAFLFNIYLKSVPFSPIQYLWIYLIMNGPLALSLGREHIRANLINQKPIRKNSFIITRPMLWNVALNGLFIVIVLSVFQLTDILGVDEIKKSTVSFLLLTLMLTMYSISCREVDNASSIITLHKNLRLIWSIIFLVLVQFVLCRFYLNVFNIETVELTLWLKLVGFSASIIVFNEIIKLIRRLKMRFRNDANLISR